MRVLSVRYYTKADNPSELIREGKTKTFEGAITKTISWSLII